MDESIGACINLQHLNISYNKLSSLPQSISKCIELQSFEAMNNNICGSLNHIDFSKCTKSKEFDASNNEITTIHLPNLYELLQTAQMDSKKKLQIWYN